MPTAQDSGRRARTDRSPIGARWVRARRAAWPGLVAAVALGVVATAVGRLVPVVGAPVVAIVGGIGVALVRPPADSWRPGLRTGSRQVLQASVVLLGTALSFRQLVTTGLGSLPVMLGSLTVALAGAVVVGRALGIRRDLRTLIGVGTGICGASAIAATDAVLEAPEADVAYAVATVFVFNVLAVLTFPPVGHLLHLSPRAFGLWSGTAVNDMSSVVATATVFGNGALPTAVVVKLTRTLMIVPVTLGLALWRSRDGVEDAGRPPLLHHARRAVPGFLLWFVAAAALNSIGVIPAAWHGALTDAAQFMITVALGAIGLSTDARGVRRAGFRPLVLGAVLWVLVATASLGLQAATGRLH